jgi:hypothetical protein
MQPNALLTWQNFIIVKSECYKRTCYPTSSCPRPSLFRRRGRNGDNFGLALARSRPCEPALGSLDKAPTESTLRARAETGIVRIGDPLSKPRMWNEKLSKAYNEICSV